MSREQLDGLLFVQDAVRVCSWPSRLLFSFRGFSLYLPTLYLLLLQYPDYQSILPLLYRVYSGSPKVSMHKGNEHPANFYNFFNW